MAEPDFYLSDEQRTLQQALREFVSKEITPIAARCDAEERYPVDLFQKLGELGYLGLRFPEKSGGAGPRTWRGSKSPHRGVRCLCNSGCSSSRAG